MDSSNDQKKFIKEYKILEKIGQGSFSKLKKLEWQGEYFALKYGYITAMKNKYKTLQSTDGSKNLF